MATTDLTQQPYQDAYGNSYSMDISNGYRPSARPDTSTAAYLQSIGKKDNGWNRFWLGGFKGEQNWASSINAAYEDYMGAYNTFWNSAASQFQQQKDLGYNPYYSDSVKPSAATHEDQAGMLASTRVQAGQAELAKIGQLFGLMQTAMDVAQKSQQLKFNEAELQKAQTELSYLPDYLKNRNEIQSQQAFYARDYYLGRNDVQNFRSLNLSRNYDILETVKKRNMLAYDIYAYQNGLPSIYARNYLNGMAGLDLARMKKQYELYMKYVPTWTEFQNNSNVLSNKFTKAQNEQFEKLLDNYIKGIQNEGLQADIASKELNWKNKSFGLDKGIEYIGKLLGIGSQAVGFASGLAGFRAMPLQMNMQQQRLNQLDNNLELQWYRTLNPHY